MRDRAGGFLGLPEGAGAEVDFPIKIGYVITSI